MYEPAFTESYRWTKIEHINRYHWLARELASSTGRTLVLGIAAWFVAVKAIRASNARLRSCLTAILPLLAMADLMGAHWWDSPTIEPTYWTNPPVTARVLQADPTFIRLYGFDHYAAGEPGYASEPVDFFPARDTLAWSLPPVWGLKSADGHTPIRPRRTERYEELANRIGVRFRLESVSHILVGFPDSRKTFGEPEKVGTAYLYRNRGALPCARMMGRPVYAKDEHEAEAEMKRLGTACLDRPVIEDSTHPLSPDAKASGSATITVDMPERLKISTASDDDAFLIVTDSFDPGWSATIDGKAARISPAYLAYRAVFIPAGKHSVVFRYQPPGFWLGFGVSLLGAVGVAFTFFAPWRLDSIGPEHGTTLWPRRWPIALAFAIAGLVVVSTIRIGRNDAGMSPKVSAAEREGFLGIQRRWLGSFHRFTWGAGIEGMRPRPEPAP